MRKLGKKNQVSNESVEAFFCFCVVCACSCYCSTYSNKYYGTSKYKSSQDSSRRTSQYR